MGQGGQGGQGFSQGRAGAVLDYTRLDTTMHTYAEYARETGSRSIATSLVDGISTLIIAACPRMRTITSIDATINHTDKW